MSIERKCSPVCELYSHCLTASSYEGGIMSCPGDSEGNLTISNWWIGPSRSMELSTWFKFCSRVFSSSSQFVVSAGSGFWRKLCQTVNNRRNIPPKVIATGPAILQLLNDAVLPTTVNTAPTRTKNIGVNFSSRYISLFVDLWLLCWAVDWLKVFSIHWVVMISKGRQFLFWSLQVSFMIQSSAADIGPLDWTPRLPW